MHAGTTVTSTQRSKTFCFISCVAWSSKPKTSLVQTRRFQWVLEIFCSSCGTLQLLATSSRDDDQFNFKPAELSGLPSYRLTLQASQTLLLRNICQVDENDVGLYYLPEKTESISLKKDNGNSFKSHGSIDPQMTAAANR